PVNLYMPTQLGDFPCQRQYGIEVSSMIIGRMKTESYSANTALIQLLELTLANVGSDYRDASRAILPKCLNGRQRYCVVRAVNAWLDHHRAGCSQHFLNSFIVANAAIFDAGAMLRIVGIVDV